MRYIGGHHGAPPARVWSERGGGLFGADATDTAEGSRFVWDPGATVPHFERCRT